MAGATLHDGLTAVIDLVPFAEAAAEMRRLQEETDQAWADLQEALQAEEDKQRELNAPVVEASLRVEAALSDLAIEQQQVALLSAWELPLEYTRFDSGRSFKTMPEHANDIARELKSTKVSELREYRNRKQVAIRRFKARTWEPFHEVFCTELSLPLSVSFVDQWGDVVDPVEHFIGAVAGRRAALDAARAALDALERAIAENPDADPPFRSVDAARGEIEAQQAKVDEEIASWNAGMNAARNVPAAAISDYEEIRSRYAKVGMDLPECNPAA